MSAPVFMTSTATSFPVGQVSSFTVRVSGDPIPVVTHSALPAGLSMADEGSGVLVLNGVPTTTGSTPITLTATSSQGTATQTLTVNVTPVGAIGSSAPPPGYVTRVANTEGATGFPGPVPNGTTQFEPVTGQADTSGSNTPVTGSTGSYGTANFTKQFAGPSMSSTVDTGGVNGGTGEHLPLQGVEGTGPNVGTLNGSEISTQADGAGVPGSYVSTTAALAAGRLPYRAPATVVAPMSSEVNTVDTGTAANAYSNGAGLYGPVIDRSLPFPASYSFKSFDTTGTGGNPGIGVLTPPSVPTAVVALPRANGLRVLWNASTAATGGQPLKGYEVRIYPARLTAITPNTPFIASAYASGTETSIEVDDLQTGTTIIAGQVSQYAYKAAVLAFSNYGSSVLSALSAAAIPYNDSAGPRTTFAGGYKTGDVNAPVALAAPTSAAGTSPSVGTAKITWTAPTSDGDYDILSYKVVASTGQTVYAKQPTNTSQNTSDAAPTTVTMLGLVSGSKPTFTVQAVAYDQGGNVHLGPVSAASAAVTIS